MKSGDDELEDGMGSESLAEEVSTVIKKLRLCSSKFSVLNLCIRHNVLGPVGSFLACYLEVISTTPCSLRR